MSSIPPFPLPSQPKVKIQFRSPTVADSLELCGIRKEMEEAATTDYLRQLMTGDGPDPELWTAQDRRTALWWIFIAINDDTRLSYSYECAHCGETHLTDIDLADLDDGILTLTGDPYIEDEISIGGEVLQARFHPLDGRAVTHLEEKRLELFAADDEQTKRIKAEIKVLEVVHSFSLQKLNELSWEDATAAKLEIVRNMDRMREFQPLVARCLLAAEELRHGLPVEITEGVVSLVSPPLFCESKAKEAADHEPVPATVLLLRFRPIDFIPTL